MSVWQLGSERTDAPTLMSSDIQSYIANVTKWIPGDILAIYAAGVNVLKDSPGAHPDLRWLLGMALVTPIIVLLSAWSAGQVRHEHFAKAILALFAFAIWSITIPFSGWQLWDLISQKPGFITVLAGLAGLLFGFFAEGVILRIPKS